MQIEEIYANSCSKQTNNKSNKKLNKKTKIFFAVYEQISVLVSIGGGSVSAIGYDFKYYPENVLMFYFIYWATGG